MMIREELQAQLVRRARVAARLSDFFWGAALWALLVDLAPSWFGGSPDVPWLPFQPLLLMVAISADLLADHWRRKADNLPEDLSWMEHA